MQIVRSCPVEPIGKCRTGDSGPRDEDVRVSMEFYHCVTEPQRLLYKELLLSCLERVEMDRRLAANLIADVVG